MPGICFELRPRPAILGAPAAPAARRSFRIGRLEIAVYSGGLWCHLAEVEAEAQRAEAAVAAWRKRIEDRRRELAGPEAREGVSSLTSPAQPNQAAPALSEDAARAAMCSDEAPR